MDSEDLKATQEIQWNLEEDVKENPTDVLLGIFEELVESWLEVNAHDAFAAAMLNRKNTSPGNKRKKL